jgi:four helix bundle protein
MKILDSLVTMVERVHALARKVARHDRDLAQQMRRSSSSVALNGSEGVWAKAGKPWYDRVSYYGKGESSGYFGQPPA